MATTNTVTEVAPGVTVYSFSALANGDSFDIAAPNAESVLFQVTGGTFNSSTVALVGSLDGTNFAPLYSRYQPATGLAAITAVAATAANVQVFETTPARVYRLSVTGGTGTELTAVVVIRNRIGC